MLQISAQLSTQFTTYISHQGVPVEQHRYYLKWLRYFLDFRHKYQFKQETNESLSAFLKKLDQKRQSLQQQKQAKQAIQYYFACTQSSQLKKYNNHKNITIHGANVSPNTISEGRQEYKMLEIVSPKSRGTANKEIPIEIKGSDWTGVFTKLQNSIRVRHYSQTTLKTYSGWVRKFQAFTKSKDPRLLGTEDVKEFLTSLAVKKKVAASTQNQAFNALLFFYRHVLGQEFDKVEGVVRAKRKPYIPIVLSREEIDQILAKLK